MKTKIEIETVLVRVTLIAIYSSILFALFY